MDLPWYIKSAKLAEIFQIFFFLGGIVAHSYIEFVVDRKDQELLMDWVLYLPCFLSICLGLKVICDMNELVVKSKAIGSMKFQGSGDIYDGG